MSDILLHRKDATSDQMKLQRVIDLYQGRIVMSILRISISDSEFLDPDQNTCFLDKIMSYLPSKRRIIKTSARHNTAFTPRCKRHNIHYALTCTCSNAA